MKRTEFTYGQLDRVLRSLGFTSCMLDEEPPARVYNHQSGALLMFPTFPEDDKVYGYHMVMTQVTLDNFGIADPTVLEAKLRKAG